MSTVIKNKRWSKKKNPKKGTQLQKLANRMLLRHEVTPEYFLIRKAAEFHLGFWDWQRKPYNFGVSNGAQCNKIRCGYFPAGSLECRMEDHSCP